MAKFVTIKSAGRAALLATLMSGSAVVAQDVSVASAPAAVEAVQPVPAPPVQAAPTPSIAPLPIVRTVPTENDVVNPVAAQQAADEQKQAQVERRPTRIVAPKATQERVAAPSNVAPPPSQSGDISPTLNEPTPAVATDTSETPPMITAEPVVTAQPVSTAADGNIQAEDLTLFAGIAAALAALGLGGFLVSRRRRDAVPERALTTHVEPPVQTRPSPPIAKEAEVTSPVWQPPVATRANVQVTDPLFSATVRPQPITDPLFAPRNDVEIPITDPLFAKNARFSGRIREQKPISVCEPVS